MSLIKITKSSLNCSFLVEEDLVYYSAQIYGIGGQQNTLFSGLVKFGPKNANINAASRTLDAGE